MRHAHTDEHREDGLRSMSWALRTCGTGILVGLLLLPASLMAQNGALDTTFSDDGLVTTSFGGDTSLVRALVIQPNDRRLVAAGTSSRTGGGGFGEEFALARYESGPAGSATFDTYRLTRIDETFGLAFVSVSDINEKGEMVGLTGSGPGGPAEPRRAVLLRGGMVVELGDLMGGASPQTIPIAINDLTQITGVSSVPDPSGLVGSRGFLWDAGQIQDLGIDPDVFAADINNRGQIVGTQSLDLFNVKPFVWEAGRTTSPESPSCPPITITGTASAINENGLIVGTRAGNAVMWRNGEVIAQESGQPVDVNNRDEVIGFRFTPEQNEPVEIPEEYTSFLWNEGGLTMLPPLVGNPFVQTHAQSINNEGQIVGYTRVNPNFGSSPPPEWVALERATLWQEGAVVDLNTLISDDDPLKPFVALNVATRITDSGLIVAVGLDLRDGFEHPYLLTPTGVSFTAVSPPPSSPDTDSGGGTTASLPPSSSDTDSGGGAVDLLSLLLLILGLSSFFRSQGVHRARPFG